MRQISASMDATEEKTTRDSFNRNVPLWFDTGKKDKEGNRIFRSLDTEQEQVFVDEEK